MNTYEVLEKGLAELQGRGWHQGGYIGSDGGVCIGGACQLAEGLPADHEAMTLGDPARAILDLLPQKYRYVAEWNDEENRTQVEVEDLFRKAIRNEKQKAGVPIELPTTTREEVAA